MVFDVPGALTPLRFIQYDEEPDKSSEEERAKRAEQALKEFSKELKRKVKQAAMERVSFYEESVTN